MRGFSSYIGRKWQKLYIYTIEDMRATIHSNLLGCRYGAIIWQKTGCQLSKSCWRCHLRRVKSDVRSAFPFESVKKDSTPQFPWVVRSKCWHFESPPFKPSCVVYDLQKEQLRGGDFPVLRSRSQKSWQRSDIWRFLCKTSVKVFTKVCKKLVNVFRVSVSGRQLEFHDEYISEQRSGFPVHKLLATVDGSRHGSRQSRRRSPAERGVCWRIPVCIPRGMVHCDHPVLRKPHKLHGQIHDSRWETYSLSRFFRNI